jgi:thiol-disulfide isomerase/thioredoxin
MLRTLLLGALAVAGFATSAHADDVLKVGDRLKELDTGVDANGKPFKLKSLTGKWVLVTVGAEWCVPCAKELPAWDEIAGTFKGKVTFVAVDIDNSISDGKAFHDKLKLHNVTRVYMPQEHSAVASNYGSDHMPSSFIADPKGVIRYVRDGFEKGDVDGEKKKLTATLTKLLTP